MRRLVLCALFAAACGGSDKPSLRDDAGTPPPGADAGGDAASARVVGCLDTAGLATPPTQQLPCDLVPPGLTP